MARDVFLDSSGLYALADHRDPDRPKARECVERCLREKGRLILTDYVLDESLTLAKARRGSHAALSLLEIVENSDGFRMEWIGPERFAAAKTFFRRHADHAYSFTDCTSFVVMRELRLRDALTGDTHFAEAGFRALLAS